MNQAEKEQYLREYSLLKNEGKPFFPYAVAKDSLMAVIVMIVIMVLSLLFGAELGPKVSPTTTTYVPRPDWYFFFLFEVLRVMKNVPKFTPFATLGVPTLCMIMLFLLPLYDRNPERLITRRPVALAAGLATIACIAFLTYSGASTGSPNQVSLPPPAARVQPRVRLPGLPRDRRQRQRRPWAAPDPHRRDRASGRDRYDAGESDRADAVLRGYGYGDAEEVFGSGSVPLDASVSNTAVAVPAGPPLASRL